MNYELGFLSRDLMAAIKKRHGSLRRFYREVIGDQLSYYLYRKATSGELRPIVQIKIIEDAAVGLLTDESVRGKVPDPPEELRMATRLLVAACKMVLENPNFDHMVNLSQRTVEADRLCST